MKKLIYLSTIIAKLFSVSTAAYANTEVVTVAELNDDLVSCVEANAETSENLVKVCNEEIIGLLAAEGYEIQVKRPHAG